MYKQQLIRFDADDTRGIGTCHALFYEAAAANLERQHKFQQAEAMHLDTVVQILC